MFAPFDVRSLACWLELAELSAQCLFRALPGRKRPGFEATPAEAGLNAAYVKPASAGAAW